MASEHPTPIEAIRAQVAAPRPASPHPADQRDYTGAAAGGFAGGAFVAYRMGQQYHAAHGSTPPAQQRLLAYRAATQARAQAGSNSAAVGIARNISAIHTIGGNAGAARIGDVFQSAEMQGLMHQQMPTGFLARVRAMMPSGRLEHRYWNNTRHGVATQVGAATVGPGAPGIGRTVGAAVGAAVRPTARAALQASAMSALRHPTVAAAGGFISVGSAIGHWIHGRMSNRN